MLIRKSPKKVAVGLYFGLKLDILAILATFFKISTSNLFCPAFTLILIGKRNKKSIGLKITILAPERPQKWR